MIYFEYDTDGKITYQHNNPEILGRANSDLEKTGILIQDNSLPIPEIIEGKLPCLRVDVNTKKLVYDYIDKPVIQKPLSLEDQINQLREEKLALENYVLELDYRLTVKELGI